MLSSNCAVCGKKKSMFIKNQDLHQAITLIKFKMNKIVNKLSFNRRKFMYKLHLRQPVLGYSVCWPFNTHHERIKKFRKEK